jgi:hypothetical protein
MAVTNKREDLLIRCEPGVEGRLGESMRGGKSKQALEFLVSCVLREAELEGTPLSEVERKMLFFSETYPVLPDLEEVAQKFEEECDQDQYEEKMAALSRNAYQRLKQESPDMVRRWIEAIKVLGSEDHYLLVFIFNPGSGFGALAQGARPRGDLGRLILMALIVVCLLIAVAVGGYWISENYRVHISERWQYILFGSALALTVFLTWNKKASEVVMKPFDWLLERATNWMDSGSDRKRP